MSLLIENISVDCSDPFRLAQFWSQMLGLPVHPDDESGDDEVAVPLDGDRLLLFIKVPEPKTVKNRMHLCLQARPSRDEEIERVLGIGATMFDDRRRPDGTGWAVLADPEGNEFCVLRSSEERHSTS